MRELTYYVASSVDGFIAHTDGSHGGFSQDSEYFADLFASFPETVPSHLRDLMGIHAENKYFDVVLMGRNTWLFWVFGENRIMRYHYLISAVWTFILTACLIYPTLLLKVAPKKRLRFS